MSKFAEVVPVEGSNFTATVGGEPVGIVMGLIWRYPRVIKLNGESSNVTEYYSLKEIDDG